MIKRSRFNGLITDISSKTGVNLSDTTKVLNSYMKEIAVMLDGLEVNPDPLCYGILKLDTQIKCNPGITVIYSADDIGKTSVLKTIAMNMIKQNQMVLYIDAENKLYLHQLDKLEGVYFTTTNDLDAVRQMIDTGLIDVILIDTISSMPHNTLKAFMFSLKKRIPFVIVAAQMRVDINTRKKVPACSDSILSSAHTHIYLTESEKILFERVDMKRIQFSIMKYEADVSKARTRSSFIISKSMVSNFWSTIDHLHSIGMIRAHGQNKFLDGKLLGKYIDAINNESTILELVKLTWSSLSDIEVDFGIFCESGITLLEMQTEGDEGEQDYSPTGEEEHTDTDSSRLSYD